MERNRTLIAGFLIGIVLLGAGLYYQFGFHAKEEENVRTETALADEYLDLLKTYATDNPGISIPPEVGTWEYYDALNAASDPRTWMQYASNIWYKDYNVSLTPSYGAGVIQCVLEIPSIDLKRGIYTGTWEELTQDYKAWMPGAARPDYVLGTTHYSIYCRSLFQTELGFSRIAELSIGDTFSLTSEKGHFTYTVNDTFALDTTDVQKNFVDNFYVIPETCCLITNNGGSNTTRYVVAAQLSNWQSLDEYFNLQ